MEKSRGKIYLRFIADSLLCQMVGIIGLIFTTPAIPTWYADLRKPGLAPPNWVFAPIWTTLYFMTDVLLFTVWNVRIDKSGVRSSIIVFAIQLALDIFGPVHSSNCGLHCSAYVES